MFNVELRAGAAFGPSRLNAVSGVEMKETMSMKDDEIPLRCKAVGGDIEMGIGMKVLAFAAENHPDFWDGESDMDVPNIKITDVQEFALEVARAINDEAEDGSTLLTRMLDAAIAKAVEDGCDGVDHDA